MLELSPVGRGGTPDEVATVAALLMGPDGAFITGSDVLMDGGVTASYFFGELAHRDPASRSSPRERHARRGVADRRPWPWPRDFLKRNHSMTVRDERFSA
jgi:hypothetical protein